MHRLTAAFLLALPLFTLWLGCSKKHRPTAAMAPAGYSGSVTSGARAKTDAGARPGSDEDAGGGHGPLLQECMNVPSVNFLGEDMPGVYLNGITAPGDFHVTRVVATWEDDCANPTIRIEMSEGSCPADSKGHSLVFRLNAQAISAGTIGQGLNTIEPNPTSDGIYIRYVRPIIRHPNGTWGTCDAASGTLSMTDQLDTKALTRFQARFELELTACDGTGAALQNVSGAFNVLLRRGLSDVCP